MGSRCWTPLEQTIVLVSPESIRNNTSAVLVLRTLGHKRRERWHAVGRLCKHRFPFDGVEGVETVCENEPVVCLV